MQTKSRPIELLSPAKDLNCGIEAINHGADAVYIGAPKFGARSAAGNSLEDIRELCEYAHLYEARIYVTLNTILKEEELEEAERMIWDLWRVGTDALIIQDMGITRLNLPPIPLHASTQTDNRTPEKVRFLEAAGFTQVVLARELSLNEIRRISEATTVPLEVFVHGALCVSYSGQCYLSAALSGRSANRGECAQYCRLPYTMVDATGTEIVTHKHLLSLKDMNRSDQLEALLDAGVSSLKIEGRLKDVGYVKNITAYYRKKLDAVLSRRPEYRRASAGRSTYTFEPVAEKSFNRGFTPFLLEGRMADITAFNTPKSLGEPVGMVKEIKGNSFTVAGLKQLNNGDGLVFFNRKGELEGFRVNRVEANRVFPLDMPQLAPKTPLYRNFDQAFDKLLAKPSAERKLSVEIEFLDNPFGFTLCMEDETGARIMLTEPFAKELARREQQDNIRTQLSKLGNTPFEASKVVVGLSENWFVPSSLLADMRRRGVEKLLEARRARYPRETVKRVQPSVSIPFPERQLTYLGNVANGKARSFYQDHGVEQIDPAFELSPRKDVPLMFTKHCLRYSMGWCPTYQKDKSPYKEPYYLLYKDTRLRLQFDCKHCQMLVFES
ncbi:peptidase U32 family protein [Parabacteroides merdae]|uniref:Collagenase-like protease n=3 Tax=Parabacteroides merdae TaxID=46503 RepID=A0A7K1HCP8_9BACT|nr:U32 family peptidase [Parabacteroides merdae]MTU28878.1 collagenase-like protease [Parabacteroides merdae]RYS85372.1 U32 family peptidase [Parabacteroides merdae]